MTYVDDLEDDEMPQYQKLYQFSPQQEAEILADLILAWNQLPIDHRITVLDLADELLESSSG
jgi:hypothetical protein